MGSFAHLYLGDFEFESCKNGHHLQSLVAFREFDRFPRGDWRRSARHAQYRTTARTVRRRLDVLGVTTHASRTWFDQHIREHLSEHGLLTLPDFRCEESALKSLTFERWLQAFRYVIEHKLTPCASNTAVPARLASAVRWVLHCEDGNFGFPGALDMPLRLAVDMVSDDEPVYAELADVLHGGWISGKKGLLSTQAGPVLVLTEGSSDARYISTAMNLLFPEMADFFYFFDFGLNTAGGVGILVQLLKQFAAAGIDKQVVAIFDNDSAARDALRGLAKVPLPSSYRILTLPELDLARRYPTLGPSGHSMMNINGLAAALEVFFPPQVLRGTDGELTAVHWRGYQSGVKSYQGELIDKHGVQRRMDHLLASIKKGDTLTKDVDFSGLSLVLNALFDVYVT